MARKRIITDMKAYRKEYKSKPQHIKRRKELIKKNLCECGGKYDSEHYTAHTKTRKHNKYLSVVLMNEPLIDFECPHFETVDITYFQIFDFENATDELDGYLSL